MSTPSSVLLPLLSALLTPTTLCSQEDTQVRWYDLRPLISKGEGLGQNVDMRLHLSSSRLDALEPDRYGIAAEDGSDWGANDLARAVADVLAEELPDLDADAELRNGMLRVEGAPPVQALAVELLQELRVALLRPVDLELVGMDASLVPLGTGSVLDARAAEALLSTVHPTHLHRRAVLMDRRAELGREGVHAILMDYDVEVASKASAADPQVTTLRDGVHLGVRVRETLDGRLLVRVWGRAGFLPMQYAGTVMPELGGAPLESASEETRLMVSSGVIEDGGALLLRTGQGESDVWMLRVRRSGPYKDVPNPLLSLSDACLSPMLVEPPRLGRAAPSGGWSEDDSMFLETLGPGADGALLQVEDVLDRLSELRDRVGQGVGPYLVGSRVLLHGSEALRDQGRALVANLVRAFAPHTVELELRYEVLDSSSASTLGDAGWDETSLARLTHSLQGACRTGDGLLLVSGEERFYLQDYDVEVAEAATIADPIVGLLFHGVSFFARPLDLGAGHYQVSGELSMHAEGPRERQVPVALYRFLEDPTRTDPERPMGRFDVEGRLTMPSTARAGGQLVLELEVDRWTTLLRESMGRDGRALVAAVRLRRP